MNTDQAIKESRALMFRLKALQLITTEGEAALSRLLDRLNAIKRAGKTNWEVSIPRDAPIVFQDTDAKRIKYRLRVDLHGQLSEPNPQTNRPTGKHCIVIRVWRLDRQQWYKAQLDHPEIVELVERGGRPPRRVMLRFRFDYDDHSLDEEHNDLHPQYHLQIGGQMADDEYCRIVENLAVPRFIHHPLGLTMAIEFVVRNFFPAHRTIFDDENALREALTASQRAYLLPYITSIGAYGNSFQSSFHRHVSRLEG